MTLIAQYVIETYIYVHKRKGKANIHNCFLIFLNNFLQCFITILFNRFFLFSSDLSLENSDEPDVPYLPGIKWQINLSLCQEANAHLPSCNVRTFILK